MNTADRELLEAAAKAAGIVGAYVTFWDTGERCYCGPEWGLEGWNANRTERSLWNPLEDDGDALRLAAQLGIGIDYAQGYVASYAGSCMAQQFTECTYAAASPGKLKDAAAATRRAIVRAAASMGATK